MQMFHRVNDDRGFSMIESLICIITVMLVVFGSVFLVKRMYSCSDEIMRKSMELLEKKNAALSVS
ncbi:hypothetical protein [Treponema sp.]|uniref:hypothetical protein n=1 Tax=Treponema sp. TaxID=166 RepID=UPI00257CB459|nr:hypothetical protein [Treponema sp.]MBE6354448.1 hypothetical protein [Treponema sp.]